MARTHAGRDSELLNPPLKLLVILCVGVALSNAAAQDCSPDEVLYMALEPVKNLVGFSGETRRQYLDRRYAGWQPDGTQLVRSVPPKGEEAIRISLTAPDGGLIEQADLFVESKFEYVDGGDRQVERVGHREIGRYPLALNATVEIAVPKNAFRESGALLVAVTLHHAGERRVVVADLPVELTLCPRRIYTHDRFSAIRLNRGHAK